MALIDYKGFRLVASSCLPIGKGSLKYGENLAKNTKQVIFQTLEKKKVLVTLELLSMTLLQS